MMMLSISAIDTAVAGVTRFRIHKDLLEDVKVAIAKCV